MRKKPGPKVVYIATPCKGELPLHYITALDGLRQSQTKELRFEWAATATGSIAICRDILSHMALTIPEVAGILFVDSDMRWRPEHAHRIIGHNLPIVGATYAKKELPTSWVMTGLPGEPPDPKTGLMEVHEMGTGFLYIAREVFLAIQEKHRALTEFFVPNRHTGKLEQRFNYFWQGVADKQFHGEDYGFCRLARQAGFHIYADVNCLIPHIGSIDYPLSEDAKISQVLPVEIAVQPTA